MMRLAVAALCGMAFAVFAASGPYPDVARAKPDIEAALKQAAAANKRVLIEFGGNWCGDCKVLAIHFHAPENASVLEKSFILVYVNVGDKGITDNFDVARGYGIPLEKGVPALAVLDPDGRVVYSQKNGEFESMKKVDPQSVNEFLRKWSRQ